MCRPTSDEQIGAIDKESRNAAAGGNAMYSNQSIQAEVSYRQERIKRDFARAAARRQRRERQRPKHAA
jgi:hypothetical protein